MLNRKWLIIFSIITLLLIVVLSFSFFSNNKEKEEQEIKVTQDQQQKTKLSMILENSESGVIAKDGFEISFLESEQVFVLKVTNNPFQGNITNAKNHLKTLNIDINDIRYICSVSRGVDATEEEVEKCGNTIIQ